MARMFVNELKEGDQVDAVFLVRRKRLESFRNKPGQYLALQLEDRTGVIEAKAWDNGPELAAALEEGAPARIKGYVETFQDRPQIKCQGAWPVPLEEVDLADFLPTSARPVEEMTAELEGLIGSVEQAQLQALLEQVFTAETKEAFAQAPGSIRAHHAYLGGLLEHTLQVARLLEELCRIYPALDRDLLVTACLLHDIGKLQEYRYDTVLDYTAHGRLLGHVVIGTALVQRALEEVPDFPTDLAARLLHMLISHHGEREFGAPVLPATAEAAALHYAEYLETKVNQFLAKIDQARQRAPGQVWTEYDRMLERSLFVGLGEEE